MVVCTKRHIFYGRVCSRASNARASQQEKYAEKLAYHVVALVYVMGELSGGEAVGAEVVNAQQLQSAFPVSPVYGPPCTERNLLRSFSWRTKEGREELDRATSFDDFKAEAERMKTWKSMVKQLEDTCKAAARELRAHLASYFALASRLATAALCLAIGSCSWRLAVAKVAVIAEVVQQTKMQQPNCPGWQRSCNDWRGSSSCPRCLSSRLRSSKLAADSTCANRTWSKACQKLQTFVRRLQTNS